MVQNNLKTDKAGIDEKIRKRMERDTEKVIKKHLCKKCGGVFVRSFATSMMAQSYGKSCKCKSSSGNKG